MFEITDGIFADNIETARVKAKQAVETSNIETYVNSDDDDVPQKRNHKRPNRLAEEEGRDTDDSMDSPMKKKPIEMFTSKGRNETAVEVNSTQGTDRLHVRKPAVSKSSTKTDCEKSHPKQTVTKWNQIQADAKKRLNLELDGVTHVPQLSVLSLSSSSRKTTEIASEQHGWFFIVSSMQQNLCCSSCILCNLIF